jgi:hypothetical protein
MGATMTQTFMHEFVSPINRYWALAVMHGHQVKQVYEYEGRQCYIVSVRRTKSGKRRSWYNALSVHFIDDGSPAMIPAGKFNKVARVAAGELEARTVS